MSDTLSTRADSTDAELIMAVRGGDTEAYGELFGRHRDAASRLARQLVRGPDADDLVAESFIRVLSVLQAGKGPDEFFRAYLLTSVRRLHIDRIRAGSKVRPTGDEAELDRAVEFVDPVEMRFEKGAAAAAFGSLPERWQLVLWHLDVEGQKPADIAQLLGMSPNSVSALAYRAREGLRQAYLQGHLAPILHESCRQTTGMLGAHVRKGLSARDTAKVDHHLDDCSRCAGLHLELEEVNSNLSGALGPALLGSAFAGYAATTAGVATLGAGATTAVGVKVVAGGAIKLAIEPVKLLGAAVAGAGTQGVVAVAVVMTVATAGTVAVTTDFGTTAQDGSSISAPPAGRTTPAPTTPSSPMPTSTPTPGPTTSPTTSPSTQPTPSSLPTLAPPPDVPTSEAPPTRTPEPTSTPTPSETPATEPSRTPPPEPTPPPDPIVPTDYGIGAYTITDDDSLLQRRFTIPVTAAAAGRAADQSVTIAVQFTRPVQFRGVVSPGWDCGGAVRDQQLSTVTCTSTLPAGQGTTFIVKARGIRPDGTISVTATDDPQPANNSVTFQSRPYLLLL